MAQLGYLTQGLSQDCSKAIGWAAILWILDWSCRIYFQVQFHGCQYEALVSHHAGPSIGRLRTWHQLLPGRVTWKKEEERNQDRSHGVFYFSILDVSSHHFWPIQLYYRSTLVQCGMGLYKNMTTRNWRSLELSWQLAIRDTEGVVGAARHEWEQTWWILFIICGFVSSTYLWHHLRTSTADFPSSHRLSSRSDGYHAWRRGLFLLTLYAWPPPCKEPHGRRPGFIHGQLHSGNSLPAWDSS